MALINDVEDQMKTAMRERDELRLGTLRLMLSELRLAEKNKRSDLDEAEELKVLQRERKRRTEASQAFRKGDRIEQAEREEAELVIIDEFMPSQLGKEDLVAIVDDVIAATGATSSDQLGKVMGAVMPRVAGQADGNRVREVVADRLAAAGAA